MKQLGKSGKAPFGKPTAILFVTIIPAIILWLAYFSNNRILAIILSLSSFGCILAGFYLYSGKFILFCKKRFEEAFNSLERYKKFPDKHPRHLIFIYERQGSYFCICERCLGFYEGLFIFFLLSNINSNITKLWLPNNISLLIFFMILGMALTALPAVHGLARRTQNGSIEFRRSRFILYFSGFLVAFGGFLNYWALISMYHYDLFSFISI